MFYKQANGIDPVQMPQKVASDHGLHRLHKIYIQVNFEKMIGNKFYTPKMVKSLIQFIKVKS